MGERWRVQVKTRGGWADVQTSDGVVYEYDSAEAADRMLRAFYPGAASNAAGYGGPWGRVVQAADDTDD